MRWVSRSRLCARFAVSPGSTPDLIVAFSPPVTHDTKNESGKPVRTLVIELKK